VRLRQEDLNLKRVALFVAGVACALALVWAAGGFQPCACLSGSAYAVFSPDAGDALLPVLYSAQETLDVELYQFSNPDFKDALVSAAARGVRVRVILEPRVDSNYETAQFLAERGVKVRWATLDYTNTHSKYAVVDNAIVIVGSANWSKQAMNSNREADVVITDERIAAEFTDAFETDWNAGSVAS